MAKPSVIAYVICYLAHYCACKITGHTNTNTPKVLEIAKYNIFFVPEEAMLLAW